MRRYIALIATFMLLLSGCGNKNVDYVGESDTGSESVTTDIREDTSSKKYISDRIEEEYGIPNGMIKFNADVVGLESYDKIPVVSVKTKHLSSEDMEEYARKIFDNGKYEVVNPKQFMSKGELSTRISEIDGEFNVIGTTPEEVESVDSEYRENYKYLADEYFRCQELLEGKSSGYFDNDWLFDGDGDPRYTDDVLGYVIIDKDREPFVNEGIKWYECPDNDEGTGVSVYYCVLDGKVNGEAATISFRRVGTSDDQSFDDMIFSVNKNLGYAPFDCPVYSEKLTLVTEDQGSSDNNSGMTYDEIKTLCEDYISGLNLNDFEINRIFDMPEGSLSCAFSEYDTSKKDGYVVILTRKIAGYSMPYTIRYALGTVSLNYDSENNLLHNTELESIQLFVKNGAVCGMRYKAPVEVTEIKENINVTSFENVKEVAVKCMEKNIAGTDISNLYISDIEIGYTRITDPENICKITYVPAVFFFRDEPVKKVADRDPFLVINAIDGSEIDYWGADLV